MARTVEAALVALVVAVSASSVGALNGATDTSLNAGGPLDTAYQSLVPTPAPAPGPAVRDAAASTAASPEAQNKPPTLPVPVTDSIGTGSGRKLLLNGATDTSLNAGGPLDTAYQTLVPTPAPGPGPAASAAAPVAASPDAQNKPPSLPVPVTDSIGSASGRKLLLNGATDTSLNAGGPLDTAYQSLVPTPAPGPGPAASAATPTAASPEAQNKPPTLPVPVTDSIGTGSGR